MKYEALKVEKKPYRKMWRWMQGDRSAMRQLCVSVSVVCVRLCYCPLRNDGIQREGERTNTYKVITTLFLVLYR